MRNSSYFKNEASRSHLCKDSVNMDWKSNGIFKLYTLEIGFSQKSWKENSKKEINLGETNWYTKGRKWYISYFSSRDCFRRYRVLFQVSIFMMILVTLIYILGFRSYTHNNYLFFCIWHIRMSPESCKYLLNVAEPLITKKDARFRIAISPAERLCLTLHYLAYSGSQKSLNRFISNRYINNQQYNK